MTNASGTTTSGDPYLRVFLPDGVLQAGESITWRLRFERGAVHRRCTNMLDFLSGQGKP